MMLYSVASHSGVTYSWGLAYNLLGEKLTGINIFPPNVYDTSTWTRASSAFLQS